MQVYTIQKSPRHCTRAAARCSHEVAAAAPLAEAPVQPGGTAAPHVLYPAIQPAREVFTCQDESFFYSQCIEKLVLNRWGFRTSLHRSDSY